MKILVELELEATFYEGSKGVKLEMLSFPGASQNLMPFLSINELDNAQQALEDEVEKAAMEKADEIRERREMRGDFRREQLRDDMRMDAFGSKA